jgi:protease I
MSNTTLTGKRVAFLTSNEGVEASELEEPWRVLRAAGAEVELLAPNAGAVTLLHHLEPAGTHAVDRVVADSDPEAYDALVLPGGVVNADRLRLEPKAVHFVHAYFATGRPVAVICHGAWILIDAAVALGRHLTSWPSLRIDLVNAGARWLDAEVHVDGQLISSRKPDDLPAFCRTLHDALASGVPAPTSEMR